MRFKQGAVIGAAVVAALGGVRVSLGASAVYTPTTTTENWNGSPNWSPAPLSADDTWMSFVGDNTTVLPDTLANINTNDLGAFQLNILYLQGTGPATGAASITIGSAAGSSLNFVTDASGPNLPTVNLNAVTSGTGTLTYAVTSAITLSDTTAFAGAGTATFNFSGPIGGAGGLTKSGASTLILSGANGYSGATQINAGALRITNNTALGSTAGSTTINSGGVLQLQGGITVTGETLSLVGDGLGSTTGAFRSLSGNNTWAGDLTVQTGTTTRVTSDSGTFTINGNVQLASAATTDQFVLQGAGSGVINGIISGVARVTRGANGAGTWTLNGANTYTGQTAISNGALSVSSINRVVGGTASSSLGAPATAPLGTILMGSGSTSGQLIYTGAGETTDRIIQMAGAGGGATITSNGAGPLIFTSPIVVASTTKTLTLQGSNTGENEFTSSLPNPTTGNLNLTKAGTGTWVRNVANTYAGNTAVSGGILSVRHPQALGTTAGGTSVTTSGSLQLQGGITIAGESLSLTGDGPNSAGVLRNVSGDNAWTGNVTINAAGTTRIFSAAGRLTISGDVALSPTASDQFVLQGDGAGTIGGVISGISRVTHSSSGTGIWTFSGNNTFTGKTTISNGGISVGSLNRVAGGTAASNLGAPTTVADGTIDLGGSGATGVLIYTGTGETSDRVLNLAGTSGGGAVNASGGGALVLTGGVTATGAGDKTLTLTGTGTAANTLGGAIVDNSAANQTSLAKTGTGTWALSGSNTYTGPTSVSAGLLLVNGVHGGESARIDAGYSVAGSNNNPAALGGTGTIYFAAGRAIAITSDSAAPNGSDNGAISPGNPFVNGGIGDLSIDGGAGIVFDQNSTFAVQTADTGVNDRLRLAGGGIAMPTTSDHLALTSTAAGVFTIATYDGVRDGVFDIVSINGISQPGTFSTVGQTTTFTAASGDLSVLYDDGAKSIEVTINNPVPEPATTGLLAMAATGLLGRRRSKR